MKKLLTFVTATILLATGAFASAEKVPGRADSASVRASKTLYAAPGANVVFSNGGSITMADFSIDTGSLTASGGAISFGNENLTTTGTLAAGATTVTGTIASSGHVNIGSPTDRTALNVIESTGAVLSLQRDGSPASGIDNFEVYIEDGGGTSTTRKGTVYGNFGNGMRFVNQRTGANANIAFHTNNSVGAQAEITKDGEFKLLNDNKGIYVGAGSDAYTQWTGSAWQLVLANGGAAQEVADGTNDVKFSGGISTDGQAAPTSGITTGGIVTINAPSNDYDGFVLQLKNTETGAASYPTMIDFYNRNSGFAVGGAGATIGYTAYLNEFQMKAGARPGTDIITFYTDAGAGALKRLEITNAGAIKNPVDNAGFYTGASDEFRFYHTGATGYINNTTGVTTIDAAADVYLRPNSGENGVQAIANGAVRLYYDSDLVFTTKADGAYFGDSDVGGQISILRPSTSTVTDPHIVLQSQTTGSVDGDTYIRYGTQSYNWAIGLDQSNTSRFQIQADTQMGNTPDWSIDVNGQTFYGRTTSGSQIQLLTSDGSDNGVMQISSGGLPGNTRGGYISLYGNQHASAAGQIQLVAGGNSEATGTIEFWTGPTTAVRAGSVTNAGDFTMEYGLTVGHSSHAPETHEGSSPEFNVLGTSWDDSRALLASYSASTYPILVLGRTRTTSIGDVGSGVLQSGDVLGQISFSATDQSEFQNAVIIYAQATANHVASTSAGADLIFALDSQDNDLGNVVEAFRMTTIRNSGGGALMNRRDYGTYASGYWTGAGDDFGFYHNGSDNIIEAGGSNISFKVQGGTNFTITQSGGGYPYASIPGGDFGSGVNGSVLFVGNNTNATPGAGSIALTAGNGTTYYLWVDSTGDLRINTSPPTNANDTAGTVVGSQS